MRGSHFPQTSPFLLPFRFKDYIDDAEEFLDKVVTQTMNPSKYFLWGQSYGGLIAPHCFLRFKSR